MPGMPTFVKTHSVSVIATSALAVHRFIAAAGGYATSSSDVLGVSEIPVAAAGGGCSCITHYSALVEAAEALADGDWVKPSGDGSGRAALGSDTDACGRAVGGASAGQLVEVRLMLQTGRRDAGPGTGVLRAPALIVNAGFSTALAAAMEALSAALPTDGQWTEPRTAEQGVIELGHGAWDLERTLTIDIAGASVSRHGLTIRGQGEKATILRVPTSGLAANFKGGDNIWRAIKISGGSSFRTNFLRLENFGLVVYPTGTAGFADATRWLDIVASMYTDLARLHVYARYMAAMSTNQYLVCMEDCYFSGMQDVVAYGFPGTGQTAPNLAGDAKGRHGGVGFRFKNNNSLIARNIHAHGHNLGYHFINEGGLTLYGGSLENVNKGMLFDGDSKGNRVCGMRGEWSMLNYPIELPDEMYYVRFGEDTRQNYVEHFGTPPLILGQDYSERRDNVVRSLHYVPPLPRAANLIAAATWANGSGVTTSALASGDLPTHIDPAVTAGVEVTCTGSLNQYRRLSATFAVNPDWGSVRLRTLMKRVSGAGMLMMQAVAAIGSGSVPIYASQPQQPAYPALGSYRTVGLSAATWSGGKITITAVRAHGVQAGMAVKNVGAWGSIAADTTFYVESATATTAVLIAGGGGSISDPGAITPGSMTMIGTMAYWAMLPDFTTEWQEYMCLVRLRLRVSSAPSLNGSDKLVLTLSGSLLGLQTGAKIRLSGFADSRLNGLDYTLQGGDFSGSTLTLSGAASFAGLDASATSKGLADGGVTNYGFVGLTEIGVEYRVITNNAGQNIVWRMAGEQVLPGAGV